MVVSKVSRETSLTLIWFYRQNLRILAQSSKRGLLPNEYIAIAGDSYAVGAGDWLEEVRKNSFFGSPDYSAAHLIYEKNRDRCRLFWPGRCWQFWRNMERANHPVFIHKLRQKLSTFPTKIFFDIFL